MIFKNNSMNVAYQMGAYKAIAEMMSDRIRNLSTADSDFEREWEMKMLVSLADQLDDAKHKFSGEVDTA